MILNGFEGNFGHFRPFLNAIPQKIQYMFARICSILANMYCIFGGMAFRKG